MKHAAGPRHDRLVDLRPGREVAQKPGRNERQITGEGHGHARAAGPQPVAQGEKRPETGKVRVTSAV